MQRFYGIELADRYRGRLSDRRLLTLIRELPSESATMRAIDPDTVWGLSEQLAASQIDMLAQLGWLYASAHSKGRVPRPKQIPRPGVEPATTRLGDTAALDQDDVRAFLDRFRPEGTVSHG